MTNVAQSAASNGCQPKRLVFRQLNRPLLMGILNLTPESFSDGGKFFDNGQVSTPLVVAAALDMARAGADIIDFGAEATSFHRAGVAPVSPNNQIQRLSAALRQTRQELDKQGFASVTISIDTRSASVARAALDLGAGMINDVSGGRTDPAILELAAIADCPIILMHAWPETPEEPPQPRIDVLADVMSDLQEIKSAALRAGVKAEQIILDPGIGFGKAPGDNWRLLQGLGALRSLSVPLVLGISRKRITRDILPPNAQDWQHRDIATAILIAALASMPVAIYRVHDIQLCQIVISAIQHLGRPVAVSDAAQADDLA